MHCHLKKKLRHLFKACYLLGLSEGTVHNRLWQTLKVLDTPIPQVGSFLYQSIGRFQPIFDPSPLLIADIFYGRPQSTVHCIVIGWTRLAFP